MKTPRKDALKSEQTLNEIAQELTSLTLSTSEARRRATQALAVQWARHRDELRAELLAWKTALGADLLVTFEWSEGSWLLNSSLSDGFDAQTPSEIREGEQDALLSALFGEEPARLTRLALASHELHMDYRSGLIIVPFIISESPCGLIFSRVESGERMSLRYRDIADRTSRALERMRAVVLAPLPKHNGTRARAS